MKRYLFSILLVVMITMAYGTPDTLRNYTPGSQSIYFPNYPMQIARFDLPRPGVIQALLVTVGGDNPNGAALLHLYGHEGGNIVPQLEIDLITPLLLQKTQAGDQQLLVELPSPLYLNNNQFFVAIDSLTNGAVPASDTVDYDPFCLAGSTGGDFYKQYFKNTSGSYSYKTNAFKIDVIIGYDSLPEPTYLEDYTAASGILADNYSNRGASVGDFNGDGWDDLIRRNLLYKNVDGVFQDITTEAGIHGNPYASAFADMDNDGALDIVFVLIDSVIIYRNNGDETFTLYTAATSTADLGYDGTQTFSVADINNDKYPDLFIGRLWKTYPTPLPNYLYLNNKDMTLTDITTVLYPSPLLNKKRTRASQFVDFDDDGDMDLYITNYYLEKDEFWKNNGDGTFSNIIVEKGIDMNNSGSNHGTGVAWSDYDNDGDMDLLLPQFAHPGFVVQYDHRGTTLYRNEGAPGYDFTDLIGTPTPDDDIQFEETHAGAAFGDLNNDGLLDFYITNFYNCRYSDMYEQTADHKFTLKTQHYLPSQYINTGEDLLLFDFNNDGRLDILTGLYNYYVVLFKNNHPENHHYLKLNLRSVNGNAFALGARATVFAGGQQFTREVSTGRGARMGDPYTLHFGLGDQSIVDSVVVKWPGSPVVLETFEGLLCDHAYTLTEGGQIGFTGIHNQDDASFFTLAPNPVQKNRRITISAYFETPGKVEVTLMGLSSQTSLVLMPSFDVEAGNFSYKIDSPQFQNISPGVYIVKVKFNQHFFYKKLVIVE